MWQAEARVIMIMIIVLQKQHFCVCQGSGGSRCGGCGYVDVGFGTASASGSGNATFHNLFPFYGRARWQTAQKSAAEIQMNSKLLKRQPSRAGSVVRGGSASAAETAVSVTTTFDLKRAASERVRRNYYYILCEFNEFCLFHWTQREKGCG